MKKNLHPRPTARHGRWLYLLALLFGSLPAFAQVPAGYCVTGLGGFCGGNDITDVALLGTTLNATGLTCTTAGGQAYTAYPATGSNTATLAGGNRYSIRVTTTGASIISAWIDFNRNGQLEASEWAQVDFASTANTASTVSLNVPANAVQGQTVLRVRSRAVGNPNGAGDACLNFGSGETKNFVVTIGAPAACPTASNAAVGSITATSAALTFTTSPSATGGYTVTTTPQGGTASTQTVTASPVNLTGLLPNTAYTVSIVSNCAGSTTSQPLALQFTTLPTPAANNDCTAAVAVPVTATCATPTNGTVLGATQSVAPTTGCGFGITTANDVWFSFIAGGSSQVITLNPRFPAVLDVRNGTCTTNTSQFCTTAFTGNTTGALVGGLTAGQTYFVRVYPSAAMPPTAANSAFTLCINPGPTPPANDECTGAIAVAVAANCTTPTAGTVAGASQSQAPTTNCGGTTANDLWFSFVASGPTQTITLNPRFFAALDVRNGTCTANTSQFCTTAPVGNTAGALVGGLTAGQTYFIRVYATATAPPTGANAAFTLCINPGPTPPANDECTGAIAVAVAANCTTPTAGTVAGASQSLPRSTTCGFGTTANDVWFSFVASATSQSVEANAASGAVLELLSGPCTATTALSCVTLTANTARTTLLGGLTAGQTYFLRIYSTTANPMGAAAGFTLCVTAAPTAPANDECAGALPLPVQFGTTCQTQTVGDNTAATGSVGPPAPTCASYQGGDLWYALTIPVGGTLTVTTDAPTAGSPITDTGMSIYSGTCGNLVEIDCDDDSNPNGFYSQIDLTGRTPGEVVYVRVWAFSAGNTGRIALCALAPSNCAAPTGPAATNVTSTSATLNWVGTTPLPAGNTYEIEYGVQGFALGTGTRVTGLTATTFNLTGLMPVIDYCFYVRQNCGPTNGSSSYVGPTCFSTPQRNPANDEPCGALALGNGTPTTDSNVGATTSLQNGINLPACSPANAPKDVWFSFTAAQTTSTVSLTGSAAGMVRVFTTPDCANGPFTQVDCASSGANNTGIGTLALTNLTIGQRYYVAVSGYGSSNVTGGFTVSATNVLLASRTKADTNALLVYPNPSNTGQLTLRLTLGAANGPAQLALLNTLGQKVLSQSATISNGSLERSLSTRSLAAGVYTLQVKVGEQLLTRKVVLE